MKRMIEVAALLGLALAPAAAAGQAPASPFAPANPSFEEGEPLPSGWRVMEGARIADGGPTAVVALDRSAAASAGRAALRFASDAATRSWPALYQDLPARPGERVVLAVAGRSQRLRREGRQYRQANGFLFFLDESGAVIRGEATAVLQGTRDWVDLQCQAITPPKAVTLRVGLVASLSGTAWFDDVRLQRVAPEPFDEAARSAALDALEGHLRRSYPFFGLPGKPDPGPLFARFRPRALAARTPEAFIPVVAELLGNFNDLHISLQGPEGALATVPPAAHPRNWNIDAVRAALSETILSRRNLLAGRLEAGPAYALIGSFALPEEEWALLEGALDRLAGAPALILDVRPNGGGDERLAARLAARFAKQPVVYAKHRFRDPTLGGLDGFEEPMERVLEPRKGAAPDSRPVAVLQGPYCVSSCEGFLLMMRALPSVATVGLPSRGASGNPGPMDLLPGWQVHASRWQALTPEGKCFEGTGLEPHARVEAPAGSHERGDPTLDRAILLLKK